MRTVSLDLRERILTALNDGQTRPQVAERFSVSVATVGRLVKQWRERQSLEPLPRPGRPRAIPEDQQEFLKNLVVTKPDATLDSLANALAEKTGKKISLSALHRNLLWLGYSYKKSLASPVREIPRSEPTSKNPSQK